MMDDVAYRYIQKVQLHCCGIDPNLLTKGEDPLPRNVHYFDICNYCIEKSSSYTHESFRAFKSLEAYKLYESGWVQWLMCKKIATGSIVVAKVKHSYRLNLKPLKCWVAVDNTGIILTGHCDCMAGPGEVCSHIGAVFFLLENWGRLSLNAGDPDEISCTDVLAQWLVPATKKLEMASVDNIDWHTHSISSTLEDVSIDSSTNLTSSNTEPFEGDFENFGQSPEDDEKEIDDFLHKIHASGVFCPIMAMREPFSKFFVQKSPQDVLRDMPEDEDEINISVIHLFLGSRHNLAYEELPLEDLQQIAKEIKLCYTQDETEFIECKTKDQSSSKLWYRFRAGRVTASIFKRVCRTQIVTPSFSLIERICYPERHIFKTQQTSYGIENESLARETYAEETRHHHNNFIIRQTGLIINNEYPFCGASPDALVTCECCGNGSVEIKCPWRLKTGKLESYLKKKDCPLVVVNRSDGSSSYELKVGHEYYYQCQMQIFLTKSDYCDFVVWQPQPTQPTIIVRVYKDEPFWLEQIAIATDFFEKVIMPELLGNYFSGQKRKSVPPRTV